MSKSIYRKLKDYIYKGDGYSTSIFGNLMSSDCIYNYENPNKKGDYIEWRYFGLYGREMDFLLDYYVIGIHPIYNIIQNEIKPMLHISLSKEKPELWVKV